MPLPLFTGATNTVQLLADRPNQTDGLTPAQLKLKFDQHAINYETYSNDVLIPAIEAQFSTKTETQAIILGQIPNGSLTDEKLSNEAGMIKSQLVESVAQLTTHKADLTAHGDIINTYRSGKDANSIFTIIEYKRLDGTLAKKSTLSGGTSPKYTTRTVIYYDVNGITVLTTKVYTLTYTVDDLTSEVTT